MRRCLVGLISLISFALFSGIPFAQYSLSLFPALRANAVPAISTTCTNPVITTDGLYSIVSFLTAETCTWTPSVDNLEIEYLIVAGGGAGGMGGGGAGGFLSGSTTLGASSALPITVGAGGVNDGGLFPTGGAGQNSQAFSNATQYTAIGGGGGGGYAVVGGSGGSGGGAGSDRSATTVGLGLAGQGNDGGVGSSGGAGGGGAGQAGTSSTPSNNRDGGNGGDGLASSITGTSIFYAGGGGGMCSGACAEGSNGGQGGGGNGSRNRYGGGTSALANTGGGGGGGDGVVETQNGGSGIVIVRFLTANTIVNPNVLSWPSAGGIVFGQALSEVLISGGSASVPGTFAFLAPNTIPAVGRMAHQMVFTPTDTSNYTSVTSVGFSNVIVQVGRATPSVTAWPTASEIVSGQALTSASLSGGSASVPGTFIFVAPTTIPVVGSSTHQVIFTPTDVTNYMTVTSSGLLNVAVTVTAPAPTQTSSPAPTESANPAPTESATPAPTQSSSPVPSESANPAPTESATPASDVNASGIELLNPLVDSPVAVAEITVTAVTLVAAVSAAVAATSAVSAVAAAAGTAVSTTASAAASSSAGRVSGGSNSSSSTSSSSRSDGRKREDESAHEVIEDELLELKKIKAGTSSKDLHAISRWGDQLSLWSSAIFIALDRPSLRLAHRVAPVSPFVSKLIGDGAYLRATLGSTVMLLPVMSMLVALDALSQLNGLFLTPPFVSLAVISVIGVFDAMSGLFGMVVFGIGLIATAGTSNSNDLRLLLGLGLLGFAPGMLASSFRNLRRPEAVSSHQLYERLTDLAVAPFLAGWATLGIVSALPALAGAKLPVVDYANSLAVCVAASMAIRIVLEELSVKYFPLRSHELNPVNLAVPKMRQKVTSMVMRMALFFFVSMAFVGHCWQLYVGTVIFIIPSFLNLYRDRFPNYPKLYHVLPSGLPGLGFALLIASASLVILQSVFGETPEFAKLAFVLLPIPGLVLSLLGVIGRAPAVGDVRWYLRPHNILLYRIGGVLVLVATLLLTHII